MLSTVILKKKEIRKTYQEICVLSYFTSGVADSCYALLNVGGDERWNGARSQLECLSPSKSSSAITREELESLLMKESPQ